MQKAAYRLALIAVLALTLSLTSIPTFALAADPATLGTYFSTGHNDPGTVGKVYKSQL